MSKFFKDHYDLVLFDKNANMLPQGIEPTFSDNEVICSTDNFYEVSKCDFAVERQFKAEID